jgi:preprotein translocase subunit SecD
VIEIPGRNADLLQVVKQTAEMRFRQVLAKDTVVPPPPAPSPSPTTTATASAKPTTTGTARPSGSASASPSIATPQPSPSPTARAIPRVEAPTPAATPPATPSASAPAAPTNSAAPSAPPVAPPAADPQAVPAAVQQQFQEFNDCSKRPQGGDDPNQPLVTCDDEGAFKFILGKAELLGTDIKTAGLGPADQRPGTADPG